MNLKTAEQWQQDMEDDPHTSAEDDITTIRRIQANALDWAWDQLQEDYQQGEQTIWDKRKELEQHPSKP